MILRTALTRSPGGASDSRRRRGDDHVGDTIDDDVQGIHGRAAREDVLLFIDDDAAAENGDRLVRLSRHGDRHTIDGKAIDRRVAGARTAQDRHRPRHDESGGDPVSGDGQTYGRERRFGGSLVRPTDRGGVKTFRTEQGWDNRDDLRGLPRVVAPRERSRVGERGRGSENGRPHRAGVPGHRLCVAGRWPSDQTGERDNGDRYAPRGKKSPASGKNFPTHAWPPAVDSAMSPRDLPGLVSLARTRSRDEKRLRASKTPTAPRSGRSARRRDVNRERLPRSEGFVRRGCQRGAATARP